VTGFPKSIRIAVEQRSGDELLWLIGIPRKEKWHESSIASILDSSTHPSKNNF
jgi:hypothetical protein